jgi:hypothetical protein
MEADTAHFPSRAAILMTRALTVLSLNLAMLFNKESRRKKLKSKKTG